MELKDTESLQPLSNSMETTFEQVFKTRFKALFAYAFTIVKDEMAAEEMVQNVFCRIWEKREQLQLQTSLNAYLYRSVYHESLNYLKHQKVKAAYRSYTQYHKDHQTDNTAGKVLLKEVEENLQAALNELPEQCRTIFQMSRFEELKYQEIASRLGIAVKTVENQMGKALRLLRLKLADILPLFIFFISQCV